MIHDYEWMIYVEVAGLCHAHSDMQFWYVLKAMAPQHSEEVTH